MFVKAGFREAEQHLRFAREMRRVIVDREPRRTALTVDLEVGENLIESVVLRQRAGFRRRPADLPGGVVTEMRLDVGERERQPPRS